MTTAFVGVGLWLATLPAQVPPTIRRSPRPALKRRSQGSMRSAIRCRKLRCCVSGTLRFRHPNNAYHLALSPNGKTVVTAGESTIAWDAATGKELWRADPPRGEFETIGSYYGCRALAFAPDGRLITPGQPGEVLIRDAATGKAEQLRPRKAGPPERGYFKCIDMSPDGKSLALASSSGVTVCDFDGKVSFEIANNPTAPLKNTNGDRLAFGGHYSYGVFAPKGKVLAAVTSDAPEVVRLLNATTGEELRRVELTAQMVRLAFSPDGIVLFATERDQSVRAYAVDTGRRDLGPHDRAEKLLRKLHLGDRGRSDRNRPWRSARPTTTSTCSTRNPANRPGGSPGMAGTRGGSRSHRTDRCSTRPAGMVLCGVGTSPVASSCPSPWESAAVRSSPRHPTESGSPIRTAATLSGWWTRARRGTAYPATQRCLV